MNEEKVLIMKERKFKPFVNERFELRNKVKKFLKSKNPNFGMNGLGEVVFYRTYSRLKSDGTNEDWADCIVRVTNGIMSIIKDYHIKNHFLWDENFWQDMAEEMAIYAFEMKWLPPGRGLFSMGTEYIYERGSIACFNCSFTTLDDFSSDVHWIMDLLMNGVGVGFEVKETGLKLYDRSLNKTLRVVIDDSREGWCDSVKILLDSFLIPNQSKIVFDYSKIRPKGTPIRGYGGIASGYEPLKKLHESIEKFCEMYKDEFFYNETMLKTDIVNLVGCCVVAGNVRRSAQMAIGDMENSTFISLKQYQLPQYSYRKEFGWMSNNSVRLSKTSDFEMLGEIANLVIENGEPGYINMINLKQGRIGKEDNLRGDQAIGMNPCGEVPLENKEICVAGSTRIQCIDKCMRIKDLLNKEVKVWNGKQWSTTKIIKTSEKTKLYRVYFSDGSRLDCTKYHEFFIRKSATHPKRGYKKVNCDYLIKRLKTDPVKLDTLLSFDLGKIEGYNEPFAYEYGFFMGDGCCGKNDRGIGIGLFGKEIYNVKMAGSRGKIFRRNGYNVDCQIVYLGRVLDYEKCKELKDINKLPDWVFEMDSYSIQKFTEGYLDADGTVIKQENADGYKIYGPQNRLRDLQILVRRIGINHTNITFGKENEVTNYGKRNYPMCSLYIPTYEAHLLQGQIKKAIHFGSDKLINPITKNTLISRRKQQRIICIEEIGEGPTYCFNEPLEHKGVFNNVITGQCNLSETFPTNCKTTEEWIKSCQFASFYCFAIYLTNTHRPETNAVIRRNRRIGVSIADFVTWKTENGTNMVTKWLREGYKRIRENVKFWANFWGVPVPIRVTTIKPGGSVPKLSGKNSGISYPNFKFYIRRIRVQEDSPMDRVLRQANVPFEKDLFSQNTIVFEFPVYGGNVKPANKVSLWEQAMNLVLVQREWADNSISNTLNFKPKWVFKESLDVCNDQRYKNSDADEVKFHHNPQTGKVEVYVMNKLHEEDDVEAVLSAIAPLTKSVSLLPQTSKGVYKQMPEEEISEEEFVRRKNLIKKINWKSFIGDGLDERYCLGDRCEVFDSLGEKK